MTQHYRTAIDGVLLDTLINAALPGGTLDPSKADRIAHTIHCHAELVNTLEKIQTKTNKSATQ